MLDGSAGRVALTEDASPPPGFPGIFAPLPPATARTCVDGKIPGWKSCVLHHQSVEAFVQQFAGTLEKLPQFLRGRAAFVDPLPDIGYALRKASILFVNAVNFAAVILICF